MMSGWNKEAPSGLVCIARHQLLVIDTRWAFLIKWPVSVIHKWKRRLLVSLLTMIAAPFIWAVTLTRRVTYWLWSEPDEGVCVLSPNLQGTRLRWQRNYSCEICCLGVCSAYLHLTARSVMSYWGFNLHLKPRPVKGSHKQCAGGRKWFAYAAGLFSLSYHKLEFICCPSCLHCPLDIIIEQILDGSCWCNLELIWEL